jgi:P27 family predicted phage terminase small subunit
MPTHLKLLRGNPAHDAINKNEPQPTIDPAIPDAPPYLIGYACDEWYRVAAELYHLKLLTRVDVQPLAAYCQAYSILRTAVETFNAMAERDPTTHGLMVKGKAGGAFQNPLLLTARQAANDMVRYAAEFGFTPAARSRISNIEGEDPRSKFGSLLAG